MKDKGEKKMHFSKKQVRIICIVIAVAMVAVIGIGVIEMLAEVL